MLARVTKDEVEPVYGLALRAIAAMRANGVEQWDDVYPARGHFEADERAGTLFKSTSPDLGGVVTLSEFQDLEYADIAWAITDPKPLVVHRLIVDPALQGRGIGKSMMNAVHKHAISLGYRSVRLDAFVGNAAANKLYESLGYRKVGQVTFRKGPFWCFNLALPSGVPVVDGRVALNR